MSGAERAGAGPGVLDVLLEIARDASRVVLEVYETAFRVEYKSPRDPVTQADARANALIVAELANAFPGVPCVAEESRPEEFAEFRRSERVFFVDPLDGTREFVDRNGEFVVMIGLLEGDRATHGVVLAPVSGLAYCGEVGRGAFVVDAAGERSPLAVSAAATVALARLVVSRSHRDAAIDRVLAALGVAECRALGSAGLKGAEVARGAAEGYVSPRHAGKRWDVCAVDALVTAAGGRVTDASGVPIDYRAASLVNDRGLVVSNTLLHGDLVERIRAALDLHPLEKQSG